MIGGGASTQIASAAVPLRFQTPGWAKGPIDLRRVGEWISMGRDLAALMFIPFLCAYGATLVWILVDVFATPDRPESVVLAVVNYLGGALIGLLVLIGLGVLWLQRRNIPTLSVTTPMGTFNMGSGDVGQATLPSKEASMAAGGRALDDSQNGETV